MISKVCQRCGNGFSVAPKERDQKFCNRACYLALKAEQITASGLPITFACKTCGKPFSRRPGDLRAYRKKFGKDPLYCSMPCSDIGRRADTEAKSFFTCVQCGKTQPMKKYGSPHRKQLFYRYQRFCNARCKGDYQIAQAAGRYERGEYKGHKKKGYVWLHVPQGANGGKKGNILEHRYLMEKKLGRPLLPTETVHHKNGQRDDNSDSNLELWSKAQPPGQRVTDKIAFAIDMLRLYPEYAKAVGVMLVDAPGHIQAA